MHYGSAIWTMDELFLVQIKNVKWFRPDITMPKIFLTGNDQDEVREG